MHGNNEPLEFDAHIYLQELFTGLIYPEEMAE